LDHGRDLINYTLNILFKQRGVVYIYLDIKDYPDTEELNISYMCMMYRYIAMENNYSIIFSEPAKGDLYTYNQQSFIDQQCRNNYEYVIISRIPDIKGYQGGVIIGNNIPITTPIKDQRRDITFEQSPASEDCLNGYVIMDSIGKAVYGEVFTACKPECTHAIKKVTKDFNIKEVEIGHYMGEENIGPKVYGYWFCEKDNSWYIVSDKINGVCLNTIAGYLYGLRVPIFKNCISKHLSDLIEAKVNKMHDLGVYHGVYHGDNILVEIIDDKITDVYIIDYGKAKYIYNNLGEIDIKAADILADYNKVLQFIKTC
jgi:serine/threonine protein kinase